MYYNCHKNLISLFHICSVFEGYVYREDRGTTNGTKALSSKVGMSRNRLQGSEEVQTLSICGAFSKIVSLMGMELNTFGYNLMTINSISV